MSWNDAQANCVSKVSKNIVYMSSLDSVCLVDSKQDNDEKPVPEIYIKFSVGRFLSIIELISGMICKQFWMQDFLKKIYHCIY